MTEEEVSREMFEGRDDNLSENMGREMMKCGAMVECERV